MLDGTLFVVKCARCGNPGKNACQDFFVYTKGKSCKKKQKHLFILILTSKFVK